MKRDHCMVWCRMPGWAAVALVLLAAGQVARGTTYSWLTTNANWNCVQAWSSTSYPHLINDVAAMAAAMMRKIWMQLDGKPAREIRMPFLASFESGTT